jgi:RNA polymerase sigma factor (sigma-70 family)
MVLAVCRRVLGDLQHAEDAFQATFLILARKPEKVRRPEALASFLYGVALRLARMARRRKRTEPARSAVIEPTDPRPHALDAMSGRELLAMVDAEVARLPEVYRLPVLLCVLQERSVEEAARILDWSTGSVRGRLARGRQMLRERLAGRGLAPSGSALALLAPAKVPHHLLSATLCNLTSTAPGTVSALAAGTSVGLGIKVLCVVCLVTAVGLGAGWPLLLAPDSPVTKAAATPVPVKNEARCDIYGDPLPEGAIARLGTLRLRAVGGQMGVPFGLIGLSSDGRTITTVARGQQINFWDATTGTLRGRHGLPIQESYGASLSSDGRLLAVQRPDFYTEIDIWDVPFGKQLQQIEFPKPQRMYRVTFSPDRKTLAGASDNNDVVLWNLVSGKRSTLKGHATVVERLVFSPDSARLATSDGRVAICWDIAKQEPLWRRKVSSGTALAYTPDSRTVIGSAGFRERAWRAWDAATGKPADGMRLPEGYSRADLAIAPYGRTLLFVQPRRLVDSDGQLRLWDLKNGKLLHTLALGAEGQIGPFFPDGKSFLTNDGALQRWELATGRSLLPNTHDLGHHAEVGCTIFSPDGQWLASAADDGSVRIWDIATAKPLHVLRFSEWDASALTFTPDGKRLLSAGFPGKVHVWDTVTGKEVRHIALLDPKLGERSKTIWKLHVMPDGRKVYTFWPADKKKTAMLTSWDLTTGQRKTHAFLAGEDDAFYTAFSPDGKVFASGGKLFDAETGLGRVDLENPPDRLGHYAFSPDGRLVAGIIARPESKGIRIWDATSGRAVHFMPADRVGHVSFAPDGRYVAGAEPDGIRLWELASGAVVMKLKRHEPMRGSYGDSFASCLSFAPDGRTVATGHLDSTVLIWSVVPASLPANAEDMRRLWDELASADATRAYAASCALVDAPEAAVRFLRTQLRPTSPAPVEQTVRLLADLDSADFRTRQTAATRLRQLGDRAAGALLETLKTNPSLEKRRRMEELLKLLEGPPSRDALREVRAVAVLERAATPAARKLLQTLASGAPAARLTREAQASLERLTRKMAVLH